MYYDVPMDGFFVRDDLETLLSAADVVFVWTEFRRRRADGALTKDGLYVKVSKVEIRRQLGSKRGDLAEYEARLTRDNRLFLG